MTFLKEPRAAYSRQNSRLEGLRLALNPYPGGPEAERLQNIWTEMECIVKYVVKLGNLTIMVEW